MGGDTETPHPAFDLRLGLTMVGQLVRDARDQFLREVVRRPPRRPWMKHREIDVLSELVRNQRPRRALEWGAGYSTLYFPELLPSGARWTSIEHDGVWAGIVRRRGLGPNVELLHIPADRRPWSDEHEDGAYEDLRRYVDIAARYAPLDFVLVDGRARRPCVRKALDWLAPNGVVVLHDANREIYREPFGLYPKTLLLLDHRSRAGGLFIGGREADPRDFVDADRQLALWHAYARLGRF